jgi:hypothetical protein
LALLGDRYYVSPEAAREPLNRRSLFNIIDFAEGWKADLIVRKERPFSAEEFRRGQPGMLRGHPMSMTSPEDVILAKLEWNELMPSERQVRDAFNVVVVQGPKLDRDYLREWAPALGVAGQLADLLRHAESLPPAESSEGPSGTS